MKISDFLNRKSMSADITSKKKEDVIRELIDLLIKSKEIRPKDKDMIVKTVLDREALGSTGIGQGVGIPHGKSPNVKNLIGAVGISRQGLDFDSLDGEPVYIFFLLLAPQASAGPHLKALARISRLLKDKYFREALRTVKNEKDLATSIFKEDQKQQ